MHIKSTDEQPSSIHILILLVISICIGVYLVSTTVLIAQDGTAFIKYARGLEKSPLAVMKSEYQHPGYPFLIVIVHKIAEMGYGDSSIWSWIYSAQAASLIFRVFAVVLLYFGGRKIVGGRFSFWAILILILLPSAAEYGSDALSDWPSIFFLSAGFLLLIWGAESGKWSMFGLSGLAAGAGYLIRPECAQVVVLGSLWLGLQLFWPRLISPELHQTGRIMGRGKALCALGLLMVGFLAAAGPYMKLKGAIFPKKQLVELSANIQSSEICEQKIPSCSDNVFVASFMPSDIAGAFGKLVQRIGEVLMWFFVPALLIGVYKYFVKRTWREPVKFFTIAFIIINVCVMILLYCKFGYMSRRHTLPLVVLTIFYIPVGLNALALWLDKGFSKTMEQVFAVRTNRGFWFSVLLVIGIFMCGGKLLLTMPIRIEKQGYRDAARWLAKNTTEQDIIAVPDSRIGFYSGRRSVEYDGRTIPKEARYVVKVFKDKRDMSSSEEMLQAKGVFFVEGKGEKSKFIVYKRGY